MSAVPTKARPGAGPGARPDDRPADLPPGDLPRGRTALGVVVSVGALVVVTGLLVVDVISTGAAAGVWSSAGLSVGVRSVSLVAACGTVGCLVLAALQAERGGVALLMRTASRWALAWLLAIVCSVVLLVGEVSTDVAASVAGSHGDVDPAEAVRQAVRGGVAAAWAAGTLAVLARATTGRRGVLGCLVLAYGALVPAVLAGHSVHAESPVVATAAMAVHVAAATTWVGGLLVMVASAGWLPHRLLVRRFSSVALWCFVAVGLSGGVNLVAQVELTALLDLGAFGWLVVVKASALLLLGGFGVLHRRHAIRRLEAGHARAFWLLACGEVVVMAGVIGVVAVLGQTAR